MKYVVSKNTGLVCPRCGCRHIPVTGTYRISDGVTRRYRECRHCGKVFCSHESVDAFAPEKKKKK